MVVLLLPLDVPKVFGLVFDMTPNVCLMETVSLVYIDILAAMRRVLLLKMVTQCAMLEEFGIFLVLADKVC